MAKIPEIDMYVGDSRPTLSFTINKDDGSGALNITGLGVDCFIQKQGGTANTFSTTTATVTNGTAGQCTYSMPSAIGTAGVYSGQLRIDLGSSNYQRTTYFQVNVKSAV